MKHLLFFVAALIATSIAAPTWQFVGDLNYGNSFNLPSYSMNPSTCTPSTSAYTFANVTITPNVTGPYLVEALSYNSIYVSMYVGSFDPANPCANFLYINPYGNDVYSETSTYIADYSGVVALTAGTNYVLVVAGTTDGFSIRLTAADQMGSSATANTWNPAYGLSGSCTPDSTPATFASFTWTANSTGSYDFIFAQYVNASYSYSSSYFYGTVYNGSLTAAQIAAASCTGFAYGYYESTYSILHYSLDVVAGSTYTIAISGSDAPISYGFWVWKTPMFYQTQTPQFTSPDHSLPCTVGSSPYVGSWGAHLVVAAGNRLIVRHSSAEDEEIYVYSGDNSGTAVTAPTSCPLTSPLVSYQDSTSSFSTNTTVGQTYTVVVTPYFGGSSTDYYLVLAWTGVTISGPNVVVSTTGAATSAGTSGVATSAGTSAGTSGAATSAGTSGAATSGGMEGSSPATQIVASVFLVLATVFALLF